MENRSNFRWGVFGVALFTVGSQVTLWILYALQHMSVVVLIAASASAIFFFIIALGLVIKYDQLKLQIVRDPLTNIYNRGYLTETIDKEIDRARRNGDSLGMILFDIDNFKSINDGYGHYTGDQILCALTDAVENVVRPYDTFGRLGGEEFAIILPEIDEKKIREIAERVRQTVEQTRLNRKFPVTVSVGATLLQEGDDMHTLYKRVDDAMFDAKQHGKNQVSFC